MDPTYLHDIRITDSPSPILAVNLEDVPSASVAIHHKNDGPTPAFVAVAGNNTKALHIIGEGTPLAVVSEAETVSSDATLTVVSDKTLGRSGASANSFYVGRNIKPSAGIADVMLSMSGPTLYVPSYTTMALTLEGNFKLGATCNIVDKNGNYIVRNGERV